MRKLILLMLIGVSTSLIHAQTEKDALRYSFLTHGGTARFIGMSGAFGALGADFSSLSTNPAGLGSFRSSSIMFSPGIEMNSVDANYLNKTSTANKPYLSFNNIGFVFSFKTQEEDGPGWQNVGLAFGYNKLKSFNQEISISGFNDRSSRLDQFMLNSDGILPENLNSAEYAVYNTYLTDSFTSNQGQLLYTNQYYNNYYINQKKRILTTGGIGEYVIAIGGNYNNVFQIGISMGIQNIKYNETTTFSESSDSTALASWDYIEHIATKGTGINFKMGMIYRPFEFLRIGAAFHTPTFINLSDVYSYEVNSNFRTPDNDGNFDYYSDGDGEMEYSYYILTPMKVIGSAALVFPKIGIFSADYEYVRYNKARLGADDYDFQIENDTIKSSFKGAHNLRLGAEIKLSPIYLRGGVSYYGAPDKDGNFGSTTGYSFGLGVRTKNAFADFGFNHSSNDMNHKMYDYETGTESSNLKYNNNSFCFTVGLSF